MSDPAPAAATMAAFSESGDAPLFALEDTSLGAGPQPLLFGNGTTPPQSAPNATASPAFATFAGNSNLGAPPSQQQPGSGSSQQGGLLAGGGSSSMIQSPGGSQLQPQLLDSEGHVVSLSTPDAQNRNIYVASLPNNFTDDNLRDLFLPFGGIVSSKMFNNDGRPGSHGRAYGFVMFAEEGSVQKAIEALVGAVVGSQRIQVRRAKPTARGPSQPGSANPTPMNSSTQAALLPQGGGLIPSPPQQQQQQQQQVPPPQQQQQQQQPQGGPSSGSGVLMIQPGGTVTLQHVGSNVMGQPIFLTPSGQQVVLAAPNAPLSQVVAPVQQQQQAAPAGGAAFSSGNQAPHLLMGAGGSGAHPMLMPAGSTTAGSNPHQHQQVQQQQVQQQQQQQQGAFFFQQQQR